MLHYLAHPFDAEIKKMEEDLEIIIFDRSKQPLIPTDVGQQIIDQEGGITLIPELAKENMSEKRLKNVVAFTNIKPLREVSLVYSRHFAKHKLINLLWRDIRETIPHGLLDKDRGKIVEWR